MGWIRSRLARQGAFAALLLVLVLCFKLLVPQGFMLSGQGSALTVSVCSDATRTAVQVTIPLPAKPGHLADADKGKCAWSGFGMAGLPGADALLLAAALAFILLLGFAAPAFPALPNMVRLRPPLRGPPAAA